MSLIQGRRKGFGDTGGPALRSRHSGLSDLLCTRRPKPVGPLLAGLGGVKGGRGVSGFCPSACCALLTCWPASSLRGNLATTAAALHRLHSGFMEGTIPPPRLDGLIQTDWLFKGLKSRSGSLRRCCCSLSARLSAVFSRKACRIQGTEDWDRASTATSIHWSEQRVTVSAPDGR
ncbi:hypothetical protein AOLI_G00013780 [Acnodon oligacanthus]